MSAKSKKPLYSNNHNKGLSLVELLVSISIVIVITTIILAKHSEFSSTILLKNLAYDIALSIRKAQVFGLSLKEFTGGGASEFDIGYGIHFDSSTPTSYILFADRDKDNVYDGSTENVEVFTLQKGNIISQFCGTLSGGTQKCSSSDISTLDVVFERPNPDAIIKADGIVSTEYSTAKITVKSSKDTTHSITVAATGQISVE